MGKIRYTVYVPLPCYQRASSARPTLNWGASSRITAIKVGHSQDCDTTASTTKTYWDGGSGNFSCLEFKGCSSGRRIMRCFYDGGHMDLPEDGIADQITLW